VLNRALAHQAERWPFIERAYGWVHQLAHILANEEQLSGSAVQTLYHQLLQDMREHRDELGPLSEALDHFLRVSASQEGHLFFCYDHSGIPATNNDLEHCFGSARYYERRTTGRRGAIPGLVVRGAVRVLAALATHAQCFLPFGLFCEDLAAWRSLRQQLDYRQEGRRRQFRFRKEPEAYLAQLEAVLLKPSLPT
jgi:hypothetical protein